MHSELIRDIEESKSEIQSERPQSAYSEQLPNGSLNSIADDVEEIRRQLAEASVELEENKIQQKKVIQKQETEIEESAREIEIYR